MKRFITIFLIFMVATVLFASKVNDQTGKNAYSWQNSSSEFVGDNGRDNRSVPNLIDYQGRITDGSNNPITTPVSIVFAIYDAEVSGTQLWSETHSSVTPVEGLVHALLGSQTTFGASLFDGSDLWLGINVDSDGEMTPRLRIASVPYAIYAQTAETDNDWTINGDDLYTDNSGSVGIGTTTPGYKLDVNGNVNISTGSSYMLGGYNFLSRNGSYNTFLGYRAGGTLNDDTGYNVLVGHQAGLNNTGGGNIFLGYRAGYQETGSNMLYIANSWDTSPLIYGEFDNDFVKINGDFQITGELRDSDNQPGTSGQVLSSTITGTDWIDAPSTGVTAIDDLTDGKTIGNCTFLGALAGQHDSTLNLQNVGIGIYSLAENTTGSHNTALGYRAGKGVSNQNMSGNIFLGYQAGSIATGDNKLYIENSDSATPLIYGEFDNDKIVINGEFQATGITRDSGGDEGTSGQVLSSIGSGTNWVDVSSGDITAVTAGTGLTGGGDTGDVTLNVNLAGGGTATTVSRSDHKHEINDLVDGKSDGFSIFLGSYAGFNDDETNNSNIGIGSFTNYYNEEGSENTIIGYSAGMGSSIHSKSGNIFLGYYAGYHEIRDNKLYIENSMSTTPLIYGDFTNGSEFVKINGEFQATGITRDSGGGAGTNGQVLSSTEFGTNWVDVSGDITGVSAGTGLTGGGDTGDVTLNVNVPLDLAGSATEVIKGTTTLSNGYGVYGKHNSSGNFGYLGSSTYGVFGSGTTAGIYGVTSSLSGYGIYGLHVSSGNYGNIGSSTHGVYGRNNASNGYGVHGYNTGSSGSGVYGHNTDLNGYGIYGNSTGYYGGYFNSNYNHNSTHVIHAEFTGTYSDAIAVYGKSRPQDYFGYGGYFEGGSHGAYGKVTPTGSNYYYGVRGNVNGGSGTNYGIYGYAGGTGINYGIYGSAGIFGTNYAGYFEGNLAYTGTLSNLSDEQLGENLEPFRDALSKIKLMNVHTFNFKQLAEEKHLNLPEGEQIGLIAQELEKILPELVTDDVHSYNKNEGIEGAESDMEEIEYKGINYIGLIPVLIEGMKEQQEQIEKQQQQIEELLRLISELQ